MNLAEMILDSVSAVRGRMALKESGYHPSDPRLMDMLGLSGTTKAGVRMDHTEMIGLPAIKRAIEILSNKVAAVPFYVFRNNADETKTWDKRHPAWKCVAIKPNEEIKRLDFIRTMTAWAIGWGNAVAYIDRPNWPNRNGRVELIPLLPDRTRPIRITQNMVKKYDIMHDLVGKLYYETRIGDEYEYFEADNCLHIRGLGPNPYVGYDICDLLIEALGGVKARLEFGQRFYGQGANPAGFFEHPGTISEEAAERIKRSIAQQSEGMGRAHRYLLLEEGMAFKPLTIDPQKAQFLEGMQFDYRVVANIVGIKVHKLIDAATNSYNSLEMAESEHRDDDIIPWINQWKGEYESKLLLQREQEEMTHSITCDDEFLDGWVSFSDRASGVVELHNNNLITRDEGRRRLNFGPSNDTDGRRFMAPMNIEFTDSKNLLDPVDPSASTTRPDSDPPSDDRDDDDSQALITQSIDTIHAGQLPVTLAADEAATPDVTSLTIQPVAIAVQDHGEVVGRQVFDELADAWLGKIRRRVGKQAVKIAAKDTSGFIDWVDRMQTESAPGAIQERVDGLYADMKEQLTAVVNSTLPEGQTLAGTVQRVVSEWESHASEQDQEPGEG